MPKRSLYAQLGDRFRGVLATAVQCGFFFVHEAAAQPPATACGACPAISVAAGETLALPARLPRLEILVRVPAGDEIGAVTAMGSLRQAGAVPGLHVVGMPTSTFDARALGLASTIVIDVVGAAGMTDADATAFQLKQRLTEARAAAPAARLGLAASPAVITALRDRGIDPYLDFMVTDVPEVTAVDRLFPISSTGAVPLWRAPHDPVAARHLVEDLARVAAVLAGGLVPGGTAVVECNGRRAATFLNPQTLETIALARGCGSAGVVVRPDQQGIERVPLSTGDVLVRVPSPEGQFADDVRVRGSAGLRVEEIVARHQAAAARQASTVRSLISTGELTLTFEAPGYPAPITVSSDTVLFAGGGRTEIAQERVRVNGLEFKGGGAPRLPIIEPERVASPPLAIALTDVYRYALDGEEQVAGIRCHVVRFEPIDRRRPLFAGRAWIAADSFALVKVAAVQTGLRGPIVASEQTDEFRMAAEGVWLLSRSDVRQMYEGAGHRTPIHRVMTFARHEINPDDFEARRAAAYRSEAILLRDTAEGFRYLTRERQSSGATPGVAVAPSASRVRTLALGVIIDPNITRPLPFAGLSYVDFNLLGTGAQLNAFFGGTYGQAAFSVPSIGGTRWQLAGRAFGIASSFNDRHFVGGRELYEQGIRQRPAHVSMWLLRPLSPRVSIRAGYEFDYTNFAAGDGTSAAFTVPADQLAHALRLSIEGQRAGWTASAWWAPARRGGWRRWGPGGAMDADGYDPAHHDYQRYGLTVARPIVVSPRLVFRFDGAWMDGHDLDRFSRYSFGAFDNRLRGYPSALIRYDRGAVARAAAAWSAGPLLRVDGFLDTAYVHDPGFGPGLRRYTGTGAAIEMPAPFGTLLALEWGYGFQGINADGRRGTQVVRVSGYKIF